MMESRVRVFAAFAVGLWVLLATAVVDGHPRVRPVEPFGITAEPARVESRPPTAHPFEPGALAAEASGTEADPKAWVAGVPATSFVPILVLGLVTAIGMVGGSRRPRAVAVAVTLAISVFAIASAVHSVHHIGHPHEAEKCPVLLASQHAPGDLPSIPAMDRPAEVVAELDLLAPVLFVPDTALRPDRGRAPPSLPA
jgi:hypothetical protein